MNSALDRENGLVSTWHAELFEVGAALLARARQSGVVVADADGADVLKMVGAIAWAAQDTPDSSAQADRLLALLMNGLRHRGPAMTRLWVIHSTGCVNIPSGVTSPACSAIVQQFLRGRAASSPSTNATREPGSLGE
jgi:hypothetical protein